MLEVSGPLTPTFDDLDQELDAMSTAVPQAHETKDHEAGAEIITLHPAIRRREVLERRFRRTLRYWTLRERAREAFDRLVTSGLYNIDEGVIEGGFDAVSEALGVGRSKAYALLMVFREAELIGPTARDVSRDRETGRHLAVEARYPVLVPPDPFVDSGVDGGVDPGVDIGVDGGSGASPLGNKTVREEELLSSSDSQGSDLPSVDNGGLDLPSASRPTQTFPTNNVTQELSDALGGSTASAVRDEWLCWLDTHEPASGEVEVQAPPARPHAAARKCAACGGTYSAHLDACPHSGCCFPAAP